MYPEQKQLNLPEIDLQMLQFWQEHQIFLESIQSRPIQNTFVFFEGPPSANGMPGIHHVVGRTIKDIFCRYKTLQGYRVPRKGGWDTHGLPIELKVEKDLGITKEDIGNTISIEEYNQKCRDTVFEYKQKWDEITQKMGYWLDLDSPYITYENSYIESVWWVLSKIYQKGLIYRGHTIQPYSPAAGTGLSSHELNQPGAYRDVTDTTAVACFRVESNSLSMIQNAFGTLPEEAFILAWTTTPWTLPSNTALCVGPEIEYSLIQTFNPYTKSPQTIILASELIKKWFDTENQKSNSEPLDFDEKKLNYKILGTAKGADLVGIRYEQLLPFESNSPKNIDGDSFRVIADSFVTTTDGTGIVHIAPTFGADDRRVAKANGIGEPVLKSEDGSIQFMVDTQGKFIEGMGPLSGKYVKDYRDQPDYKSPDIEIVIMLKERGQAFNVQKYVHSYPHCWRTDKPVIYYPLNSWFISTTKVKENLIANNQKINWKPESTGTGRFGQWLENLQDWNLSRSRFWGIPLPIWTSVKKDVVHCVGSLAELKSEIEKANASGLLSEEELSENNAFLAMWDTNNGDLHKPYIDKVVLTKENQILRRELDVIDVWFDSGAMPYGQWGVNEENYQEFLAERKYPADFIAEGVDQTRGWFYTLHAISTMLFDQPAYKNVISNGLVLDKNGEKMSKRKGNVVDPFETIDSYGADAVRWYIISNSQPWDNLKFDVKGIEETRRKLFGTLFNTYSFFTLYANIDQYVPDFDYQKIRSCANELDLWILSKLHSLRQEVEQNLNAYEPTAAARAIEQFVDKNLSNWYVRLSRRRFWKNEQSADKEAAYLTLYTCLESLTQMMSCFAPFFSDWMYRMLRQPLPNSPKSVHLTNWQSADSSWIQPSLERRIALAQDICSMILSLRKKEQIKVRQPLQKVMIPIINPDQKQDLELIANIIRTETNVKEVVAVEDSSVFTKSAKANFKVLGKKLGKDMAEVAKKIAAMNQTEIADFERNKQFKIGSYTLVEGEIEIATSDMPGYLVASEGGQTLALDITLSPELISEGKARELVNRIQNMRKDQDFNVTDKIDIVIEEAKELEDVVNTHFEYISNEVLGNSIIFATKNDQMVEVDIYENEVGIAIFRAK